MRPSVKTIYLSFSLLFGTAYASTCETNLLERINTDSNIKLVKTIDSYTCGDNACAVSFEHDSHPYSNVLVLAFLDAKNNIGINWSVITDGKANGHERIKAKKIAYLSTEKVGSESIAIKTSVESPRDAIFWPPHKVYSQETFNCLKN